MYPFSVLQVEFITNALAEARKLLKKIEDGETDADDKGQNKKGSTSSKKGDKKKVVKDAAWEEDVKKAKESVDLKSNQLTLYTKSLQVAKDILAAFEREVSALRGQIKVTDALF